MTLTYFAVGIHVLAVLYSLAAVCEEIGGRRSPSPSRIAALRAATGLALSLFLLSAFFDLTGTAKFWWDFTMIACLFSVALSVRILKGDGRR